MKILSAALTVTFLIATLACSSNSQDKAKRDAEQAKAEAKQAGREIKAEAKELSRRVDAAVQPDNESASEKVSHAEDQAQKAASRAGIKLDHAALLARVKTKLASDAGLSTLTDVHIALSGSVVTLSGAVANEDQKKAAELAASQVDGVTQVRNHLTVQP